MKRIVESYSLQENGNIIFRFSRFFFMTT